MLTKKLLLAALGMLIFIAVNAQAPCSIGTVTPSSATICEGASVTLNASFNNFTRCFTDTVKAVGNQNYQFSSVAVDNQNNVILSGAYSGDINIGVQNIAGFGARDLFVVKYDSCGKLAWVVRGGSALNDQIGSDAGKGIAVDASGNIYVVGRYNQTCSLYGTNGTSYTSLYTNNTFFPSAQDGFLVKISPNGEILWGVTITGGSNDGFNGVTVDAAGNPVVTGSFNGSPFTGNATIIDGNSALYSVSPGSSNSPTAAVIKFNTNGGFTWLTRLFNKESVTSGIATDGNNFYVTGWFSSNNDGESAQVIDALGGTSSIPNSGIGNAYLLKLSNVGGFVWATNVGNGGAGGSTLTYGNDVTVDGNGDIWLTGFYSGDSFSGLTSSTANSGFISKFNASGNHLFSNKLQITNGNDTKFNGIAVNGNIVGVIGSFKGGNAGGNDIVLVTYDLDGNQLNTQMPGGSGDDIGYAIKPFFNGFVVSGTNGAGTTIAGETLPQAGNFLWNTTATGSVTTSILWSTNSTSNSITVSPDATTTYTCTFNDGFTICSVPVTITVTPLTTPLFASITDTICTDQLPVTLSNTSDNGVTGTWNVSVINGTGSYTFTPDSGLCATPVTFNVTVLPSRRPIFNQPLAICFGSISATLPTTSLNGVQGTWNPPVVDTRVSRCYTFTPNPGVCAFDTTICVTVIDTFAIFNDVPRNINICYGGTVPVLPSTSSNNVTGTWSPAVINNLVSGLYTFTPNSGQCAFGHPYRVQVNVTPQTPQPTLACYQTATWNPTTCQWDVTGTQPQQPTLECYQSATFNNITCQWDVTGAQPPAPTVACYETATWNPTTCQWDVTGTQPQQPTLECYQTATFNNITCQWDVTGAQPPTPTVACYETATWNPSTCQWDVTGTQPQQPTLECYQSATFNNITCQWDVTGTQPQQPTLECYQTATFNNITCQWDVTGTQPPAPTVACYETATWNPSTCQWDVTGTQPQQPTLECYQTATFNNITCQWDVTGTQPPAPTVACYETATWNPSTCQWDVTGTQPQQPNLECYQTATFNNITCQWDVTGTQPPTPTVACYETATWNPSTCQWDVTGTQPQQPTLECYQSATFNNITCQWDVTGTQPQQPTLECYQTATFNNITCQWDVTGTQPQQPTLECYQTATFNNITCQWDVTGTQPQQPTLECYQTATFNNITCQWDVTGVQPPAPTVACYETATWNPSTCQWDVTGVQPPAPTVACYETATWNPSTCQWDVTGVQPPAPTVACYETATWNPTTCQWDVTGVQPPAPTVACYETATWNPSTCQWDVTGTQPQQPTLECYQTATFNNITCQWDVTGTQPPAPTVACYETATWNPSTCQWDVTGEPPVPSVTTATSCGSYYWLEHDLTFNTSGIYTITYVNEGGCTLTDSLYLTIIPKIPSTFTPILPICEGSITNINLPTTSLEGTPGTWNPPVSSTTSGCYLFTPDQGYCADTATVCLTILPRLTPTFNNISSLICASNLPVSLPTSSDNGVNGIWTDELGNVVTSITTEGWYNFYPNADLCADVYTAYYAVAPVITTDIFPQTTVTVTGTSYVLDAGSGYYSYLWNTNETTQTITVTASGNYGVTVSNGACTASDNIDVIFQNITLTQGDTTICEGQSVNLGIAGNQPGDIVVWSDGSTNASNTVTPSVTTTYSVSVNGNQLYSVTVTVIPALQPVFNINTTICAGSTAPVLSTTSDNNITGTWSPNVVDTENSACYTFTPDAGQCAAPVEICVTVNPQPAVPTVTITQPTCNTSTGCITIDAPSGYNYSINGNPASLGTAVCDLIPGVYTIEVSGEGGCNASTTATINQQPTVPTAPVITGEVNVCPFINTGTTLTYTIASPDPTVTQYIWTIPANVVANGSINGPATFSSVNPSIDIVIGNGFELQPNKQIRISAVNNCGQSTQTIFYLRTDRPTFPAGVNITASSTDICASVVNQTTIQYCVTPANGATGYSWTWGGQTQQTVDPCIDIQFDNTYAGGLLTVTATNLCGNSASETLALPNVEVSPSLVIALTQPTCTIATGSATITSPVGAGYAYSLDGGAFQSSNQFDGLSTGDHTITVTHPTICISESNATITINEQPTVPGTPVVTGTTNICDYICTGNAVTYTVNATGANYYTWIAPPHGLIDITPVTANGSQIAVTFDCGLENEPNKQIRVIAYNDCGSSELIIYYTAAQAPTMPAGSAIVPSSTDVCAGTSITYTLVPAGTGSSWSWTLPDNSTIITTTPSITLPSIPEGGQLCVRVKNSCGESEPRCTNIPSIASSVPSTPGIISGPTVVCSNVEPNGTCATYTVNPIAGVSYNWAIYSPTLGMIPVAGNGNSVCILFPASFNGGSVQVSGTNACGTGGVRTLNIPVRTAAPAPVYTIQQPDCNSTTGTIIISSPANNGDEYVLSNGTILNYPNNTFTGITPGTYNLSVQNPSQCQLATTVSVTINPQPVYTSTTEEAICEGTTYNFPWGGSTGTAGTYEHVYTATDGCDSTVTLILTVNPVYNTTSTAAICDNEYYNLPWQSDPVNQAGLYSHTYSTVNGCDSVVNIELTVHPTYNVTIEFSTCDNVGQTLPWDGTVVYQSGLYTHQYISEFGCDSTVTYNVTVHPTYNINIDAGICDNQSYPLPWGGNVTDQGVYSHTYTSEFGCDSIVNIHLYVYPTFDVTVPVAICEGQSYDLPWGQTVSTPGVYTHLYTTINGCDSTVYYELTVHPLPAVPVADLIQPTCTEATGCINITDPIGTNYTYSLNGGTPQTSPSFCNLNAGSYDVTVINEFGCTSTASFVINEQPVIPPVPTGLSGIVNVCTYMGTGQTLTYCVNPAVPTATGYIWTLPPNVTTINGETGTFNGTECITILIPAGFNLQPNKQIRVRAENQCGSSDQYIYYLRTDRPTFPVGVTITASGSDVCSSIVNQTPINYCVTPANDAVSYVWTWNGGTITTNTACADIVFNSNYNGGQLTVYAVNECGVSSTEVYNLPVITIAPGIDVSVAQPTCTIATGTITINTPVGAGYTYSLDGGVYQSSNVFDGVATGNHTITVQHPTICVVDNQATITINEQPRIPDAPTVGSTVNICQFICQDTVIRYTANAVGADIYSWTLPPHGLITIESANADSSEVYLKFHCGLELQPNKQVKVTATNECGTSAIRIFYLQAQPPTLPAGSSITASGVNSCNGGDVTYTLSPAGSGPSWQWTLPDGVTTIETTSPSITLPAIATGGQLCVKVKNNCGLSNARCFNIPSFAAQIPSTPGIISGPSLVCGNIAPNGTCATYSVNQVAGVTYNWSLVDPNNGTINYPENGNSVCILFPAGFNGGAVQVTASNACGTGGVRSFNIPVRPAVSNPVTTVEQPNCSSETGTVSITSPLGSGYEYVLNGNVISYPNVSFSGLTPGTYTIYAQNPNTCLFASASTFTVNPQPIYTTTLEETTCEGQGYTLPWGDPANVSGQYSHTYPAADGCDSTVTVNLTVHPTYQVVVDAAICQGQTYELPWGGQVNTAGTYVNTTSTEFGCDSTVTVNLTVHPTYQVVVDAAICQGQSYDLPWGGQVITAGTYVNTTSTEFGCDSTVTVNLTVHPTYQVVVDAAICQGQTYELPWGGQVNTAGTYVNTTSTEFGCDSTVTINLTVHPTYQVVVDAAICQGQSYDLPWGGQVNTAGTYVNTTSTEFGCDSTVTINLTVHPTYQVVVDAAICQGQTYELPWGGQVNTAGTYVNTTSTEFGCDSTVTINLTVHPTYQVVVDAAICQGQTYELPWGGQVNTAGTYINTTSTENGCDSTVIVNLSVNPVYQVDIDAAICNGEIYTLPWGGTVTIAGDYSNNYGTINGCDSIVTIHLVVHELPATPQFTIDQPTCNISTGCLNYLSPLGSGNSYTIDNNGVAITDAQSCGWATGTHNIFAVNEWGCVSSVVDFEVLPQPTVPQIDTISGIKNICSHIGETLCYEVQPFEAGAQYNWVLPPTGVDQVTTAPDGSSICVVFNADIVNAPNKQIRLTAINACGTSDLYILYLRADLPSAPGLIAASGNDICGSIANQTTINYSISNSVYSASGYCWTLPAGAISTTPVCPTQDLNIAVNYTSLYQGGDLAVHAINGCGSGPDRIFRLPDVTQSQAPVLNYVQPDCNNATVSVTVTSPIGAGYVYSIDNGTPQTDPSFENVGAGTHTIAVSNAGGCLSQNQTSFVINEQPVIPAQPGVPSGESNLCPFIGTGDILTYSVNPVAGATEYVWTADAGIEILTGQGTNSITISVNNAYSGGTINVYAVNPCGNSPVSTAEIVPAAPAAPNGLTGPVSICESVLNSTMVTYSINPIASATNYIWDVPGAQMIVNSGDHIEVLFPNTFTSGTVSVSYVNGCGVSAPATLNVVSNIDQSNLTASVTIPPSCDYVTGCIEIYSPVNMPGMLDPYEYSIDGSNWQTSANICGLTSGNYTVQVRRNGYCFTNNNFDLLIEPRISYPDNLTVTGEVNVCEYINTGARKIYAASCSSPGTTYSWIAPPVGLSIIRIFGNNDDSVEVEFTAGFDTASNKQLKVIATNECGANTLIYYLRADAPSNPGFISGPVNVCEFTAATGNAATYTIPEVFAATGYTWVSPDDAVVITSGQGTNTITVVYPVGYAGGSINVIAYNNCGQVTRSIRINACTSPFAGNTTPVVSGKADVMPNQQDEMKLKVYPNPSPSQFNLNVNSSSQEMMQVRILDLHGRLLKSFKMRPSETIQFGNEMLTGSYFVEVLQNGKKLTKRIIKF